MLTANIRKKFIHFFKEREHRHIPSSPVIPHDDPTILFTNAGMNQFKDVFLGHSQRDFKRAVTAQKCIRVGGKHNDLDNVGHTTRHMTFFEMLGNFSFGDYFKKEAIHFAWDLTTQVFEFPPEKVWATVFRDDDEAFELWSEILPTERIVRLGEKDNFWAMGDVGPCGPCSELLFDRGEHFGSARSPLEDPSGERFLEFWNLVFMQFNRDKAGHLGPLPQKCIDTGAGIERVVSLKMGVNSVFETDILQGIIRQIEVIAKKSYNPQESAMAAAFHVIADHIRALAFAMADGAVPSNVERGYVLRKVLRRAIRYAKRLHIEEPFLAKLLPTLNDLMGESYPELGASLSRSSEILTLEEESFYRTLKRGGNILSHIIESAENSSSKRISGEDAFKLKDTYGFPIEEIVLLAKDHDLVVNLDAYEILEKQAKERSRAASKVESQEAVDNLFKDFVDKHGACTFVGYDHDMAETTVTALIAEGNFVDKLLEGQAGLIALSETPFYAEKGGQIADMGVIEHHGALFEVDSVTSPLPGVILHKGHLKKGTLLLGEPVNAMIEISRRKRIAAHHSATHLVHLALEKILGSGVKQAGSLVEPDRLRFDFSYHKAMTQEEIRAVEHLVNEEIRANAPISTKEMTFEEARHSSEIKQFFGEKYGHMVRMVSVGTSKELCGGTHAKRTGDLGYFRILKESSIGAGLRRIEAACGPLSEQLAYEQEDRLAEISKLLDTDVTKLSPRLSALLDELHGYKMQVKKMRALHLKELAHHLLTTIDRSGSIALLTAKVDVDPDECGELANDLMQQLRSGVILLALCQEERCQILLKISDDLVKAGLHANVIIKELGPLICGGGGGKKDAAQAGGKNPSGIEAAFNRLRELVSRPCS